MMNSDRSPRGISTTALIMAEWRAVYRRRSRRRWSSAKRCRWLILFSLDGPPPVVITANFLYHHHRRWWGGSANGVFDRRFKPLIYSKRSCHSSPAIAIKAVLFDLDSTFADTAPDLTRAINAVQTTHHGCTRAPALTQLRPEMFQTALAAWLRLDGTAQTDEQTFRAARSVSDRIQSAPI
jgi:hypothetical protein